MLVQTLILWYLGSANRNSVSHQRSVSCFFRFPSSYEALQEYYEDKAIRKVYKDVVERLLLAITEEEEKDVSQSSPVLVDNDDDTVWPPWPWPPWGDDDDDDGHKGDDKGGNRSHEIKVLAKKVVAFERKLAQASLDLWVDHFPVLLFVHAIFQRHLVPGPHRNLQPCFNFKSH